MPVATAAANGLMSADDKKLGFNSYKIGTQTNPCFKIPGKLWMRICGLALLSLNGKVQFVCFSFYKQSSSVITEVCQMCGSESYMTFYHDGENFYIKVIARNSYDSTLYILSSNGSEYIGNDVINDTFTEVPIE